MSRPLGSRASSALALGAACALVAACGAHSGLEEPIFTGDRGGASAGGAGAGGAGVGGLGAGGLGAGGFGAGGGAGGSPSVCNGLAVSGGPIGSLSAQPPGSEERAPELVALAPAALGVVFARVPAMGPAEVWDAVLEPWGEWPADLGGAALASPAGGRAFAAAPSKSAGFALALRGPSDTRFAPSVEPLVDYPMGPPTQALFEGLEAAPRALDAGPLGHHLSTIRALGPYYYSHRAVLGDDGAAIVGSESGCSLDVPPRFDAVGDDEGFLSAFTSGRAWNACLDDDGIIVAPTRVQVERVSPGGAATLTTELEGVDPVVVLALVPRASGGAWLVWQENGASAESPPPVFALPLDPSGLEAGPPTVVADVGLVLTASTAAAFRSGFAFAWIEPGGRLVVRTFDGDGLLEHEAALEPSVGGGQPTEGPISLAASPDGQHLVVAFSSLAGGPGPSVRAARFSCTAGLGGP